MMAQGPVAVLPQQTPQESVPTPKVERSQHPSPTNVQVKLPVDLTPPKQEPKASLSEQFKAYEQNRPQLTAEERKLTLEGLKHAVAVGAPEMDVLEIRRDAEVSTTRLLNNHGGTLYKFAGFILGTTPYDVTIVIKSTEIVCSFADATWKSEGLKAGSILYACGLFESYKDEGDLKQITMARCYTIEKFHKPEAGPVTDEDIKRAFQERQDDIIFKLMRDLGARKLIQPP